MVLLASLFFVRAMPLDMPRAQAYLVTEPSGRMHLEDRYDELDLWTSRAVIGRWIDDSGRLFTVARLHEVAPENPSVLTREQYDGAVVVPDRKESGVRDLAISKLSPLPLPEESRAPRMPIRGFRDVLYFHGTNTTSIVAAFQPEENPYWYLAVWEILPEDDFETALESFEEKFLCEWDDVVKRDLRSEIGAGKLFGKKRAKRRPVLGEKELLRRDACLSITNYPSWNQTNAKEFTILDNLDRGGSFVSTLTNELGVMRSKYAETLPSPIDGTNVLAVARIFRTRGEYLEALEVNEVDGMEWSAAYWSSSRRELVAYLPDGGAGRLIETIRHEAFHQYLAYATSMIPASPWLNEGYAQYFEHGPDGPRDLNLADLAVYAEYLPSLFSMDYGRFYSGTDEERRFKYRLAFSVACFIEKGAPEIAREPFKDLKRDYIAALLKTRDMHKATSAAFGSEEKLKRFAAEWMKFCQGM